MKCDEILVLMMGYIDNEVSPSQRTAVEEHVKTCPDCARELDAYRRLSQTLSSISFVEPGDIVSTAFNKRTYNRAERLAGAVLASLGVLILVVYGLYAFFFSPDTPWPVKLGVAALILGALLLLTSVIRLRLRTLRVDKYREIIR
jgi:anti-sigma factor RsiW